MSFINWINPWKKTNTSTNALLNKRTNAIVKPTLWNRVRSFNPFTRKNTVTNTTGQPTFWNRVKSGFTRKNNASGQPQATLWNRVKSTFKRKNNINIKKPVVYNYNGRPLAPTNYAGNNEIPHSRPNLGNNNSNSNYNSNYNGNVGSLRNNNSVGGRRRGRKTRRSRK